MGISHRSSAGSLWRPVFLRPVPPHPRVSRAGGQRRRWLQIPLLMVIATYLWTTLPVFHRDHEYSWWIDGIWQNLAYGAAALLCLVRIPPSSPDRHAWRLVAAALAFSALANTYWCWFIQPIVPEPFPTLTDALWLAYYPCVFLAVCLLVRTRIDHFPLTVGLDGLMVGLATASVAAAVVLPTTLSDLGGGVLVLSLIHI